MPKTRIQNSKGNTVPAMAIDVPRSKCGPLMVALLVSTFSIDALGWLSGAWEGSMGKAKIEEYWTPGEGKTMLGVNRTIVDGETVAFEFLRIEERPDGIYYVAHPGARTGTEFKLTGLTENEAVFEESRITIIRKSSDIAKPARTPWWHK